MTSAAWLCVAAAFAVWAALGLGEAVRVLSGLGRRRAWTAALLFLGLAFALAAASRSLPLRAGYDNEHSFGLQALDFYGSPAKRILAEKEVSPLALLSLIERACGRRLYRLQAAQGLLWALTALLVFGALRGAGAVPAAAAAGAGFYALNQLAWLNSATVTTTNANLLYLASSVYAVAAWRSAPEGGPGLRYLAWALASSFLALAGRYEFFPVPAFALALAALERLRRPAAWKGLWPFLPFSAACAVMALCLRSATHYNGPQRSALLSPLAWGRNLADQLGALDLSPVLGLGPAAVAALALAALAAFSAAAALGRSRLPGARAWALFLAVWIFYFSAIYPADMELYPLHFMRHHLYVLLPFAYLAGLAAGELFERLPAPSWRWGAAAALLAVYGGLNARAALAAGGQWRTHDREWRLLAAAQAAWPEGCLAYDGDGGREELLAKLFGAPPQGQDLDAGCVLIYRSARSQVLDAAKDEAGSYQGFTARRWGKPVFEDAFEHRFYTIWHDRRPGASGGELTEPVPLRIGFYRLPEAGPDREAWRQFSRPKLGLDLTAQGRYDEAEAAFSRALASARPDPKLRAKLLADRGVARFYAGRHGPAAEDLAAAAALNPADLQAQLSLAVALQVLGRPADALARLDAAVALGESGKARTGGDVWSDLLTTRGYQRLALGDKRGAREDFERALKDAPPAWSRVGELQGLLAKNP